MPYVAIALKFTPNADTEPVKVRLPDPTLFVAVIVTLYAPSVVGVPVIAPVVEFNDKPAGNVPPVTAKTLPA